MISDAVLSRWLPHRSVLLWGDVVRGLLWGAVVLAWVIFARIYARLWGLTLTDPAHSDFTIFYYTARLVADGLPMYGASPARYGIEWAAGHLGNLNPPHFQLWLQPLAAIQYERAYMAWTVVNVAALAASVSIMMRTLRLRLTWRRFLVGGALVVSAAPFTAVAITSELTFLLLLPFTLAWASAVRGRWTTAGAWLGVCVALKLFCLLFVPWLLIRRRWKALAAGAGSATALFALGLIVYGPETYRLWFESLGTVGWWWLPMNASWQGVVSRIVEGGRTVTPIVQAPDMLRPLALAGALPIGLLAIWSAVRLESAKAVHAGVLVLTCGAILASPLGWVYYLPLALGPVLGVIASGEWRAIPRRWLIATGAAGALLYLPLEQVSAGQPSAALSVTLASSYFYGALIPWLALVTTARRLPE